MTSPGDRENTPTGSLSPESERNWAMFAHLSSFFAAYIALGFLGPAFVLTYQGNNSAFVRRHAAESLNFNLTWLIWIGVSILLIFVIVGIFLLIAIGIAYLILVIRGGLAASRGEEYRYPLTFRFFT